jgi:hypothetical protein
MIKIYKHIVNSLDNLVEELNSSNKINTAKFFENISSQIKIEKHENDIKELLVHWRCYFFFYFCYSLYGF